MFLELAEDYIYDPLRYADTLGEQDSPYVFVPGVGGEPGVYVREDYFDDLSEVEFEETMAYLEGAQQGMGALFGKLFSKMRERRKERKARKQTRKLETIQARGKAGTGIAGAFKGIGQAIGGIFGGGGSAPPPPIFDQGPLPVTTTTKPPMNWTPYIIGGVLLLGGVAYMNRKK